MRLNFQPSSAAESLKDDSFSADSAIGILKTEIRKKRSRVCIVEIYNSNLICFPEGRHRWVDFAQVYFALSTASSIFDTLVLQHDFNATQVPPEWHSWIQHIRKDPPTNDPVMQNLTPPWKAVSFIVFIFIYQLSKKCIFSHIMRI